MGKWAVVAAVAALLAGAAAAPASAVGGISCDYRFIAWHNGFSADLIIDNAGPAIDGWTVRMTFRSPAALASSWSAVIVQSSPVEMVATNLEWNAVISTGGMGTFGWTATAVRSEPPTAVTVNGTRC